MSPLDAALTEAQWQDLVVDALHAHGWRHMHVRRSIGRGNGWTTTTSVIGWPDIVAWRPETPSRGGRVMAVELKAQRGRLTDDQARVLGELAASGMEVHVWRPSNWDQVMEALR